MKNKVLIGICVVMIVGFVAFMAWMFVPKFGVKVYYCEGGSTFYFTDTGKVCSLKDNHYEVKTKVLTNYQKKKSDESFHKVVDENGEEIIFMGNNCYGGCYDYNASKQLREAVKAGSAEVTRQQNCVLYGQCSSSNNEPTLSNRYDY